MTRQSLLTDHPSSLSLSISFSFSSSSIVSSTGIIISFIFNLPVDYDTIDGRKDK
jgi:hypothetical protein